MPPRPGSRILDTAQLGEPGLPTDCLACAVTFTPALSERLCRRCIDLIVTHPDPTPWLRRLWPLARR